VAYYRWLQLKYVNKSNILFLPKRKEKNLQETGAINHFCKGGAAKSFGP
jgi:hypothetical protein